MEKPLHKQIMRSHSRDISAGYLTEPELQVRNVLEHSYLAFTADLVYTTNFSYSLWLHVFLP